MKKIIFLTLVAFLALSCSKKESTVAMLVPNSNSGTGESASAVFSLDVPNYFSQDAILDNSPTTKPASFPMLYNITAMLFNNPTNIMTYVSDITNSLTWNVDNAVWTVDSTLKVPVGKQQTLVVFNRLGMYDKTSAMALGSNLDNIRFHLSGAAAVTSILNGSPAVNEIAASDALVTTEISSKGSYTLSGSVKRINSKINVNIAYSQAAMFASISTGIARLRVTEISLENIPESVDFDGKNAAGSVTIKSTYKSKTNEEGEERNLHSNRAGKLTVNFTDNVMSTLAFPFDASTVSLRIKAEYTNDGGNSWISLNLAPISVNAVERNQVMNVNVWIANLSGDVEYAIGFKDWEKTINQDLDGEEN